MRLFRLPATNNRETSPSFPCHLKLQNDLVGMDLRLEELNSCISIGSEDVRIVGIYGMGGIGKTTIAKTYYNLMSCQFEGRAFLADVREVCSKGGLLSLQEQLLRDILMEKHVKIWNAYRGMVMIKNRLRFRRVLIVIDDVDQLYQLQNLAGMKDWFGLGSRIIITTRDEHLLMSHGVDAIYKAKELNNTEALQLFILKAFKDCRPPKDYVPLSTNFVNYANGLPLALEVLGSFLFGKTLNEWRTSLNRLKENPENEILDTLQISFDGLEETERQIFLDIACFFKGKNKDHVTKILDSCGFYPDIGIRVLIDKSLITIVGERLWMHDLLQEMGWKLVRQESPKEPGKRSRLWHYKDIFHVMSKNTGTEDIEGMVLELPKPKETQLSAKAFLKMKNLRLLIFHNVHFSQSLEYLSTELRFLEWHGYPNKTFPSNFQSKELVELNLCFSQVEQLWNGIKQFNNLKVMELSHSKNLIKTPDFRGIPNLEKLILEGCIQLYEIDQSIGVLEMLIQLNLKDCERLVSLPEGIYGLKALKIVNISGCSKLEYMLEELGHLECLEELDISGTAIKQTSNSSFRFNNLKILSLNGCKGQPGPLLSILPEKSSNSSGFCSLMALDLSNCNLQEETIPKDLSCLSSLREFCLSGNNFISLPASISCLSNLQSLFLDNCRKLESLHAFPSNGLSNPKPGFDIVVPGSSVPKWFSHQSSGDSLTRIELPPICSDSKWMGFALCTIFIIEDRIDPDLLDLDLGCSIKIKGHTWRHQLEVGFLNSMEQFGSDQLWLFYLSRHEFLDIDWHETTKISCHVEVMFTVHGTGFYVKKFGVRLVYEEDVFEFNQTTDQLRFSNYENFDVVHQVLDESEMDGALVKRSYNDYIKRDGAESSGRSNFDIEPHTKRLKDSD
ncbi:hypothetical protein JCGZ_22529 [Jatropha curcas]|uniref:ADP-ribosyl cyclase/cyclic ADP-ribose hydrolase n=1 Tax=Jatropha curcas TaxID=180498 RepID=A0A067JPK9_JATCU|nr:hypothetical protein JCGZ_22529 [Jatropha curcas]